MDAFRLLARSTKLTKPTTQTRNLIPSGGQRSNPQLFGRSQEEIALNENRRKSGANGSSKAHRHDAAQSIHEELDFFQTRNGNLNDATGAESVSNGHADHDPVTPVSLQSLPRTPELDQDACKRILREHKLKITVLDSDVPTNDGSTSDSKKRKRSADSSADGSSKKSKVQLYPQPLLDLSQLRSDYGISRRLAENLEKQGYRIPTEVQLGTLPLLLGHSTQTPDNSRGDASSTSLLTVAPTGSGKTLAFLIPIIDAALQRRWRRRANVRGEMAKADEQDHGSEVIIVAPTKELAHQIANEGRKLTEGTGIRVVLMRKGMRLQEADPDVAKNSTDTSASAIPAVKAEILVTTPLTLVNALQNTNAGKALANVQDLILDEADVLLDPLFQSQTLGIWKSCSNPNLRVSLWSATMGSNIEQLAMATVSSRWKDITLAHRQQNPSRLVRVVVGLKDSAIPNISHQLKYAATEAGKRLALRQLLQPSGPSTNSQQGTETAILRPPFLVFTQTIPRANALCAELRYDITPEAGGSSRIDVLHADLSDNARDSIMTRFRRGEVWVLITTDLLARGVDFRGVNGVVNYDIPTSSAAYVHRVGRTGRAGREGGVAVTLYTKEDVPFLKNVANVIAISQKSQRGEVGAGGVHDWLLAALPTPTKREKQQLKRKGVEIRRSLSGRENPKARISTKSGYDRRVRNNRRDAARSDPRDNLATKESPRGVGSDEEFEGFSD